jgi:competence protein ComEA
LGKKRYVQHFSAKNMFRFYQKWATDFLGFSATETRGFTALLCMLLVLLSSTFWGDWLFSTPDSPLPKVEMLALIDQIESRQGPAFATFEPSETRSFPSRPVTLFDFDPNQLNSTQWQQLGAPQWLAERIVKYRSKGGKFRKKEDLQRIYGFPVTLFEQLEKHIQLPEQETYPPDIFTQKMGPSTATRPPKVSRINLSTADTTALIALPYIGSKLAQRIVKFRENLGGFHQIQQVKEVWGLDSLAVGVLIERGFVEPGLLRKIAINEVGELKHPYLKPYVARALLQYRNTHGKFESAEALLQVKIMDAVALEKIKPYLTF